MKDLETAQRLGREGFTLGCTHMNISDPPSDHEWINTFLDQHTANTWKAAQESMKTQILNILKDGKIDGMNSKISNIGWLLQALTKQHD